MSGKSEIKPDVFRQHFATAIFAARKTDSDGMLMAVPRVRGDPINFSPLECIVSGVEDSGGRMHGAIITEGSTGEKLVDILLSPVRRFFAEFPRAETFVMRFDHGIFVFGPKAYTQHSRTEKMLESMDLKNIETLNWQPGQPVPHIVGLNVPLPDWLALRADRVLYRHAVAQAMDLIIATYKPPPGCRLILDYTESVVNASATTVDSWLVSDRVIVSEWAQPHIAAAREKLRGEPNWWVNADKLVYDLAQAGHIKLAPVCIETSASGTTYSPFPLLNASTDCGEADIGILRWLSLLQTETAHETFAGERWCATEVDVGLTQYYDDDQIAAINDAAKIKGAPPLSVSDRRTQAQMMLDDTPDLIVTKDRNNGLFRTLGYAIPLADTTRRPSPGATMVFSRDTDFLSLLVVWYAQFCAEDSALAEYHKANAPFLSIDECKTFQYGWLTGPDCYYKLPPLKRDSEGNTLARAEPEKPVLKAHEVYDVHSLYEQLIKLSDVGTPVERVVSFALFCASCKNDYFAGLYYVNRTHMYNAFVATGMSLVRKMDRGPCEYGVIEQNVDRYIRRCYYNVLDATASTKKNLRKFESMSYDEISAVRNKVADKKRHTPNKEALSVLRRRYQWYVSMVTGGWKGIKYVLDFAQWGWDQANKNTML